MRQAKLIGGPQDGRVLLSDNDGPLLIMKCFMPHDPDEPSVLRSGLYTRDGEPGPDGLVPFRWQGTHSQEVISDG